MEASADQGGTTNPDREVSRGQAKRSPGHSPRMQEDIYDNYGDQDSIREQIRQALERFAPILLAQMDRLIDAKLEEFVQKHPVLKTAEGGAELQAASQAFDREKQRFDFKNFANCKPPVFRGEMDPMVSMRWIDEIEESFALCDCPEKLKVLFAAHQMKGRGHEWWELQVKSHGFQLASKFPWNVFRDMFLEKFSPAAEMDRLKVEFLTIEQGEMSIADYTGSFNDKSRFCPAYTSNQEFLCDHYFRCMKPEIREFIDPLIYDTIPKMMNRALFREQELQRKVADLSGKRKVEQSTSSSVQPSFKRQRVGQGSQQQQRRQQPFQQGRRMIQDVPMCNNRGRCHVEVCRMGSNQCFKCGKSGHYAASCPSPYRLCHYCFKDDHFKANCPKLREDMRRAEQRKELDDYVDSYGVNIAGNRRWFDSIEYFKSAASNTLGLGENDNVNGRDDGLGENDNLSCRKNGCGETLGVKNGETSEIQEEIKLEGDTCDGLEEIKLCGETDEEGWQCGSVVQNGYTMCEYHLSELQSYAVWNAKKKFGAASGSGPTSGSRPRRAKKRPNTNPHDFYYYSGFGPSWGMKRGIMGADLSGIDGDVDVKEQKGKRFEPVMSEVRPMELDYMDDDDHSNDDEIGIFGRKKDRKPVKERSLKSLM